MPALTAVRPCAVNPARGMACSTSVFPGIAADRDTAPATAPMQVPH